VVREIDEAAVRCEVPPLLLQPLIENAIGHGIASLVDGGTIHLSIARRNGRVSILVENPRDPEAPPARRGGVGLTNVRRRLAMSYPDAARFDATSDTERFRVEID